MLSFIELRQARISHQDYHMLFLTLAGLCDLGRGRRQASPSCSVKTPLKQQTCRGQKREKEYHAAPPHKRNAYPKTPHWLFFPSASTALLDFDGPAAAAVHVKRGRDRHPF